MPDFAAGFLLVSFLICHVQQIMIESTECCLVNVRPIVGSLWLFQRSLRGRTKARREEGMPQGKWCPDSAASMSPTVVILFEAVVICPSVILRPSARQAHSRECATVLLLSAPITFTV